MVYTIGHSTRTTSDFVLLLKQHKVEILLDIRVVPYSRFNPQYNREALSQELKKYDILYQHIEALGGIKPTKEIMESAKSCSERSRGFGEYMKTIEFKSSLHYVIGVAKSLVVALMCAESEPTKCHRRLVADALTNEEVEVAHIISYKELRPHSTGLF